MLSTNSTAWTLLPEPHSKTLSEPDLTESHCSHYPDTQNNVPLIKNLIQKFWIKSSYVGAYPGRPDQQRAAVVWSAWNSNSPLIVDDRQQFFFKNVVDIAKSVALFNSYPGILIWVNRKNASIQTVPRTTVTHRSRCRKECVRTVPRRTRKRSKKPIST